MGYSLGGRLGVSALIDNPSLWQGAILISTHIGLSTLQAKEERILQDGRWKERFLNDPWPELIASWNSQPVFGGDISPFVRKEEDFSRENLAKTLQFWSLGRQDYYLQQIEKLPIPLLWMVGERDTKFLQMAQTLKFSHPQSRISIAKSAGHRLPWQAKEFFISEIKGFLYDVLHK